MKSKLLLPLLALTLAGSAMAQVKPEEAIKFRQSGYGFMAWNMARIKMNVEGGNFNKEEVIKAANAIQAIANSGMGALYSPASGKNVGAVKTRVKPEFFQQPDEVKKLAVAYNKEANELAKVAAAGDVAAIKAQFGKTGGTCKACHDAFRKD